MVEGQPKRAVMNTVVFKIIITVFIAATAVFSAVQAAPLAGLPDKLTPLALHDGGNVLHIAPDTLPPNTQGISVGTQIKVLRAWRDNGNAWGYHVTAQTPEGKHVLIGLEPPLNAHDTALQDYVRDTPHTGEDSLAVITFATANIDKKPALLLLECIRSPRGAVPTLGPAVLRIYKLVASDGTPGWTPLYFKFMRDMPLKGEYDSAETAMQKEIGFTTSP